MLKLDECIKYFRLDHDLGNGSKTFIRRNYTCPFFKGSELGCTIDPSFKPYGCLAFNLAGSEKEGVDCYSESRFLEKIDEDGARLSENNKVKKLLGISWEKAYIPIA